MSIQAGTTALKSLSTPIKGGTHSWPGGERVFKLEDPPTDEISATDTIWEFFKNHPKNKVE